MEVITYHSLIQATEAATILWSLASSQYPERNQSLLDSATAKMIQTLDIFALSARRVIEALPKSEPISLNASHDAEVKFRLLRAGQEKSVILKIRAQAPAAPPEKK